MKGIPKAWDGAMDGFRSGGRSLKRRWACGEGGGGDDGDQKGGQTQIRQTEKHQSGVEHHLGSLRTQSELDQTPARRQKQRQAQQ